MPGYNKHVPVLCRACGKPLCVKEKRRGQLCDWDEHLDMREKFDLLGGWTGEASDEAGDVETFWISEADLFGEVVAEGLEPTTPGSSNPRSTD